MWYSKDHMNEVITPNESTKKGGLYIGDWNAADDIATLAKLNINYVVTALPDSIAHKPEYQKNNIKQLICSADDMPNFDMTPYFDKAHDFIKDGLENGNVLVHCAAGISRSSTLTLVYLMRERKENLATALAFLRTKRPICTPNLGFQNQLREYCKKYGIN